MALLVLDGAMGKQERPDAEWVAERLALFGEVLRKISAGFAAAAEANGAVGPYRERALEHEGRMRQALEHLATKCCCADRVECLRLASRLLG